MATEMYGMMPSARTEKRSSAPPEKRLTQPNSVPLVCVEERGERLPVDAGSRHGDADAVHGQHHGREDQASAQFRDARGV